MDLTMPHAILEFLALLLLVRYSLGESNHFETGYGNNMYNTKTGYFWRHPIIDSRTDNLYTLNFKNRTCNAVHVNIVSRHGARYTSLNDMHAFTKLIQKLQHNLGNSSFDFIQNDVISYPENMADQLSRMGQYELTYLGYYYGDELRSLLTSAISENGVYLAATSKIRAQDSAKWYIEGMEHELNTSTSTHTHIRDDVLRFYDNCKKYDQESSDFSEQVKFQHGPYFQKIIHDISQRLVLNTTLTIDDVKLMYRLCATELQIHGKVDWCTILTDEEREVLEYDNDIEDYITRLYAHPVTGEMSCPLAQQIFTTLDTATTANDQGANYTKGMFQFGHSDTVIDFLAGLGLFRDNKPITADNFMELRNRSFMSSVVDPFSTHLGFILYNCGGTGVDNYALRLLFNQRPLSIPTCGSDVCWYSQVRQFYKDFIDNCELNRICSIAPSVVG